MCVRVDTLCACAIRAHFFVQRIEQAVPDKMSAPHEKRICKGLTHKQLDTSVSDYHMFAIASVIKDWRLLAPSLLLTESDQKEIAQNSS
jgi:hypothetical protein